MILPTIIDPFTHEKRVLGSIPSDPRLVAALPPYTGEVLPESEIKAFNDNNPDIPIKDQNGRTACNGFATANLIENTRDIQGQQFVLLSGWYPYAILCNGMDRGSNILQAYNLVGKIGCAPDEHVAYGTINPNRLTKEAHDSAIRFRLEIGTTYRIMETNRISCDAT